MLLKWIENDFLATDKILSTAKKSVSILFTSKYEFFSLGKIFLSGGKIFCPGGGIIFQFLCEYFLGFENSDEGVFVSKIKRYELAYYEYTGDLQVGQQITKVNGQSLVGKDYSEIVSAIRKTKITETIDLYMTDLCPESKKGNANCCRNCVQQVMSII